MPSPEVVAVPVPPPAPMAAKREPWVNGHAIKKHAGWWSRWFGRAPVVPDRLPADIRIEVQRGDERIAVLWPVQAAPECAAWLREYLKEPRSAASSEIRP